MSILIDEATRGARRRSWSHTENVPWVAWLNCRIPRLTTGYHCVLPSLVTNAIANA